MCLEVESIKKHVFQNKKQIYLGVLDLWIMLEPFLNGLKIIFKNLQKNYNFISKKVKVVICVHIIIFEGCQNALKNHCIISFKDY